MRVSSCPLSDNLLVECLSVVPVFRLELFDNFVADAQIALCY